jgi:hypothetical protein
VDAHVVIQAAWFAGLGEVHGRAQGTRQPLPMDGCGRVVAHDCVISDDQQGRTKAADVQISGLGRRIVPRNVQHASVRPDQAACLDR